MEIKDQLEEFGKKLDASIEKAVKQVREDNNTANTDTLNEVKGLAKNYQELAEKLDKAQLSKMQEQLDKIEVEQKKQGTMPSNKASELFLGAQLQKHIGAIDGGSLKAMYEQRKNVSFELKEGTVNFMSRFQKAGDMTTTNTYTNDVINPDRVLNFPVYDPNRPVHIRQFIAVGSTNSDTISYPKETAYDDGTDTVAEAGTIPQSDFDITQTESIVRKLGARMDMTVEMLDDTPYLVSYIGRRLNEKLANKEDSQILYGDGIAPNLSGITVNAASYSDSLDDSNIQRWDVLFKATVQARVSEYRANYIMLHPNDWAALMLTKDTQGRYLYPNWMGGAPVRINGALVIDNTAITEGDFLVGDFNLGAQLFDRKGTMIEFSKDNATNFEADLVTVKITERVALPVYRDNAFVYGTFSQALASGSA